MKEKHKKGDNRFDSRLADAYTFVGSGLRRTLNSFYVSSLAIANTLRRFVPYVGAVEDVFGADIDFSHLIKVYSSDETTREHYSPGIVIDTVPKAITATLIPTTSARLLLKRQNLTMRMMKAVLALHFGFYASNGSGNYGSHVDDWRVDP